MNYKYIHNIMNSPQSPDCLSPQEKQNTNILNLTSEG